MWTRSKSVILGHVDNTSQDAQQWLHPLSKRLVLNSRQSSFEFHHPPSIYVPKQTLRMVSRRLNTDMCGSQFITVASFHSPEKKTLPAKSHPILEKAKGQAFHVPVCVRYEDHQVLCCSEDSDWE
ncbi:Protein FAM90A1 [Sciurus carolinensis]|uniref:Protein FAM90A1 n=1 Tax=Sciurus carolinensis TaxID=30640 RepID=A0AA41MII5_SCICA|nr:Protein FAM90A1 [Sciurus carolinensis]